MKVLAIFGSAREKGNTARMMETELSELPEAAKIKGVYLGDFDFEGYGICRNCKTYGYCVKDDDIQQVYKNLIWDEVILFDSPTMFSDVSSELKILMELTWWMKGTLRNKIGVYMIAGRRYIESIINTLHAVMLRHQMILGSSGDLGYTFAESETIDNDPLAIRDAHLTGTRIVELYELIYKK